LIKALIKINETQIRKAIHQTYFNTSIPASPQC